MAKDKVSDWSTTASANTDIGGINIDEGCAAANINNAIRESMSQIRVFYDGSAKRTLYPSGSVDANTLEEGISYTTAATVTNFPYTAGSNTWRTLTIGTNFRGTQITQNTDDLTTMYGRAAKDTWRTWFKFWTDANHGAGSGLDADLLDGQQGAYYTNITARLGYTPIANTASSLGTVLKDVTQNMVGSTALLKRTGSGSFVQGDTSLGSFLEYSNADGSVSNNNPSGTWLCLGRATGATGGAASVTLWRRIV